MPTLCYFMPSKHLISNLQNRHLKISRFNECNDVFELGNFRAPEKTDIPTKREIRTEIRDWSAKANEKMGFICFSNHHYSPLMWAHYADQNRGACLVFEYEEKPGVKLAEVNYTRNRHVFPLREAQTLPLLTSETPLGDLIIHCATKELDWSYEEEQRLLIFFDEAKTLVKDVGCLKFLKWEDVLTLKEVYLGAKPDCCVEAIKGALPKNGEDVNVTQKRAAFRDFRIVTQENSGRHKACKDSHDCSCPKFNPT